MSKLSRVAVEPAVDTSRSPVGLAAAKEGAVHQGLLCPFELQVWTVDRMLNFELVDDPHYEGLELQAYDDPAHGRGMIVLLKRRQDGRFAIYRQPGLRLDPQIAQVGGELGEWVETDIDPARLEITRSGSTWRSASPTGRVGRSSSAWTTATAAAATQGPCWPRWDRRSTIPPPDRPTGRLRLRLGAKPTLPGPPHHHDRGCPSSEWRRRCLRSAQLGLAGARHRRR